jgi:hypothetical protein
MMMINNSTSGGTRRENWEIYGVRSLARLVLVASNPHQLWMFDAPERSSMLT